MVGEKVERLWWLHLFSLFLSSKILIQPYYKIITLN